MDQTPQPLVAIPASVGLMRTIDSPESLKSKRPKVGCDTRSMGSEPSRPITAADKSRRGLTALLSRAAPYVITLDGLILIVLGLIAMIGALRAFQGEALLLAIGGIALILFGVMMIGRWNVPALKTGLFGLTAGYFASALTEFEVATDPCDIGATFERCANDVALGAPWAVYTGPALLAVLAFVFIAFEPLNRPTAAADPDPRQGVDNLS